MFTGLIRSTGTVSSVEPRGGDVRLAFDAPGLDDTGEGDSIAVNGACLTAVSPSAGHFAADVSRETLTRTNLGRLAPGDPVNLEPSLTLGSLVGGHLVSGHVDATARVAAIEADARSTRIDIDVGGGLLRYLARKGSVAVDGTSLTVNRVAGDRISVNIVPHTLEKTIMRNYRIGSVVNIEVDMIARYLEKLLAGAPDADG